MRYRKIGATIRVDRVVGPYGLEIGRKGEPLVVLGRQFEVGGSFATAPDLRVWKIRLPWIAAGYQFGEVVSGVRVYATFPF